MNIFTSPILRGFLKKSVVLIKRNKSYKPVNFAYELFRPVSGEDRSLNPIVYVHGLAGSKELWHDVPQRIANATKRWSYTYDARDHGDTEWTGEYDYPLSIEDLKAFMETHSMKKAIIVGHSSGGYTVSMFGLKHPELTEMIINEDMAIKPEIQKNMAPHVLNYVKLWHESVKTSPPELSVAEAVIHTFNELYSKFPTKKGLEEKEFLYRYQYPIKWTPNGYDVKHNMATVIKHLEESIIHDLEEVEGVYNGPAYFMMASLSGFHEGLVDEKFKSQFPNAYVEIIEGVTHNIHLRYPDIFVEKFINFYNKHFKVSNEKSHSQA